MKPSKPMEIQQGPSSGPFLFIVNPNSGTGAARQFRRFIAPYLSDQVVVEESRSPAHHIQLAKEAHDRGFKCVIAVGGDGTVHETGTALINSPAALGIIPTGSGNGIARHLGISTEVRKAINQCLDGRIRTIDTLRVNERRAIGFCGLGFDAHVALLFDNAETRGFFTYAKLTLQAVKDYRPSSYTIDDKQIKAMSVVVANVNQFGNNAFINPEAIDDDGLCEVIQILPFPLASSPVLISRLFLKSIHKSKYVESHSTPSITILNPDRTELQVDGETAGAPDKVSIEVEPQSLKVLVP